MQGRTFGRTPTPFILPHPVWPLSLLGTGQQSERRGQTVPRLVGALLPLPFYRAALLTWGQYATRPLGSPGQR